MFDSFRQTTMTNISLRLDQDDSSASIEKLKNLATQNFTSILNNPQVYSILIKSSFFEDIKNRLYTNLYDTSSTIDINEFEKFKEQDSPKSQTSGSKSSRLSFKDLMNESFDDYINKISVDYSQFKNNHYSRRQFISGTDSSVCITNSSIINSNINQLNNFYISNQNIIAKIPKEFTTEANFFRLNKDILEKKRDLLETNCRDLIEMCGDIDFEIEKILDHSRKLYEYINLYLHPLCQDLEENLVRVKIMKNYKNTLKTKFLQNSANVIRKGIKKKKMQKTIFVMNSIKSLKEIVNLLKVLSTNPSKYQLTQELIEKGLEIIKNSESEINVLKYYEDEIMKYISKSIENVENEFLNAISENLKEKIIFDTEENSISYQDKDNDKIKIIFNSILKLDAKNEFHIKLRKILQNAFLNIFSEMNSSLMKIENHAKDKIDLEYCDPVEGEIRKLKEMRTLINYIQEAYVCIENFITKSIDNFYSQTEAKLKLLQNYSAELTSVKEIILTEINKVHAINLQKLLNLITNDSNVDSYISNYSKLSDVIIQKSVLNFKQTQLDYICYYFKIKEKKVQESVDCEDWSAVQIAPSNLQRIVNFICFCHLDDFNVKPDNEWIIQEEYVKTIQDLFSEKQKSENPENTKNTLDVFCPNLKSNQSFIFVLSTIEIIHIFYESIKLSLYLHPSLTQNIFTNLFCLLNNYVRMIKEIILDGQGYKTGKLKRYSQKEISISCSNVLIVKNMMENFVYNNLNYFSECEKELIDNFYKIITTCKTNIKTLIDSASKSSFDELSSVNFSNYPISTTAEYPVSTFVKNHIKINNIYISMINAFDTDDIIQIFTEALNSFIDQITTIIKTQNEKNKMVDETSLKQFKKDMFAIKGNLKTFKLLESECEQLRRKIDSINRLVLPKSLLKKKKAVEEEK